MFNTIIRKIRLTTYSTEFQAYLNSIQSTGHGDGPTMEEARKDFNGISVRRPNLLA